MSVKYESDSVKEVEGLCSRVNQNTVVGVTRPSSDSPTTSKGFKEIRSRCLAEGMLFEDTDFPPPPNSKWLRPKEICHNPQFFVDGPSRFDAKQGHLGDCWLVAAIANLTRHKKLFYQVVPDDQGFDKDYAGVFHFRFWQSGRWVEVVIDDRLPTYRQGRLRFLHSSQSNEFWSALLEKAYAKVIGSYGKLKGGYTNNAMVKFTGGVAETHRKRALTPDFYTTLLKTYEQNSFIAAFVKRDQGSRNIIGRHAYSITRVKYVHSKTLDSAEQIPLLRIRNPWGHREWKGAWSDKSPEWNKISLSEKKELGLTVDNDGEFWMTYDDFVKHFGGVYICKLNQEALDLAE